MPRLALVRAESNVRIAKGNLNVAMGLAVDRPVEIAEAPLRCGGRNCPM